MKRTITILLALLMVLSFAACGGGGGSGEKNTLFSNGLAGVKVGDKWGYIDKSGNFVINPQFDRVSQFAPNGLAYVKSGELYGYIDKKAIMLSIHSLRQQADLLLMVSLL